MIPHGTCQPKVGCRQTALASAVGAAEQVGWAPDGGESTGHESGRIISELLQKDDDEFDDDDLKHMRKVISYVHRHQAQGPSKDVEHSKWRYSLMNWWMRISICSCSITSAYLNGQLVFPNVHRNTGGDECTELLTTSACALHGSTCCSQQRCVLMPTTKHAECATWQPWRL